MEHVEDRMSHIYPAILLRGIMRTITYSLPHIQTLHSDEASVQLLKLELITPVEPGI